MIKRKSYIKKTSRQKPSLPSEMVFVKSPIGRIYILGNKEGVSQITFRYSGKKSTKLSKTLVLAQKEIREYFSGTRKKFSFPINQVGTQLQVSVWKVLLKVPYKQTISYKELAKKSGFPKAVRAVANAVGKNKLLIRIPCHRIVASNGKLGGFSAGISKKIWLLNHESQNML